MGWVPEGQRSGQMSYSTSNKTSAFVTIGEEDAATFEAISAGRQFEDIQAQMAFRLLQKMMLKEEMAILAGNASLVLGTPGTPTLSASGAGATLPAATYFVKVVALTLEGYQNSSVLAGVATSKNVTGADSKTFTLSGGSSNTSAEASQPLTLGQTLFCSVSPVQGAVAYAWYVSTSSGNETLQAITTINSLAISAPLATGTQPQSSIAADNSANPSYAYDGLLTTALKPGSNAYLNILPTGTAGAGTALTASGRGSVVEIDTMFQKMWDNFQVSPTVLYVNSQELKNITAKVLSSSSGPLLRYDNPADGSAGEYQLTASGVVQFYYNPFALNGGLRIPIRIHPKVPPDYHRLGRESANPVPIERGPERRRDQDAARLLPNRLADRHSPTASWGLCRGGTGRLRSLCNGRHLQYRKRMTVMSKTLAPPLEPSAAATPGSNPGASAGSDPIRLRGAFGQDEASHGTVRFSIDNDGLIYVPPEVAYPLLTVGGFALAQAGGSPGSLGVVKLCHDEAAACSYAGRQYLRTTNGDFLVPANAATELSAHGFVPVVEEERSAGTEKASSRRRSSRD